MRAAPLTMLLAATLIACPPVRAADEKPGRFTMTPAEGGALKLDTVTGATSFCTRADGDWACKLTKDGEQILRKEIDGLKGEIDVLKEQLTKMEEIAGIGDPSKADGGRPGGPRPQAKMDLPTEKDVDQAFDYFERMVKKLRERLNKLEGDGKSGTPL
jgi:hypothetical protein